VKISKLAVLVDGGLQKVVTEAWRQKGHGENRMESSVLSRRRDGGPLPYRGEVEGNATQTKQRLNRFD